MCDLALSNCRTCDDHTPKKPVIENKACNNRTAKLSTACVGTCACYLTPFMARPDLAKLMSTREVTSKHTNFVPGC